MKTNFISVKSVLYDLSLLIDDKYYNEAKMLEWALKALRQVATHLTLQDKVVALQVTEHRAALPCDFKYLNQIAYLASNTSPLIDNVTVNQDFPNDTWKVYAQYANDFRPMRLSTSTFHEAICVDMSVVKCPNCLHEYSISPELILTTTLKEGTILVSYKAFSHTSDNDYLIPDNETLKEALTHACLYKYWMSKYQMKEDGADSRMTFHMKMWNMYAHKAAGELNLPDLNELENLRSMTRLVPRTQAGDNFFTNLNYEEQLDF